MEPPLLPPLSAFTGKGEPLHLNGTPPKVLDGAQRYIEFADNCHTAATTIRSLNTTEFQGPEAERFRGKLDEKLPTWLTTAGDAYRAVGRQSATSAPSSPPNTRRCAA